MIKICRLCLKEKDLSRFYFRNDTKKYRGLCKECISKKQSKYRKLNWIAVRNGKYRWQKNNPEKIREIMKRYYEKNKVKIKEYTKIYKRNRTLEQRLKDCIRKRIWSALRGYTKAKKSTLEELGVNSIEEFKNYIQNQFQEGMSWKNYGKEWHIDHIVPCSYWDLNKKEERYLCFHYKNLQPMWAKENRIKSDKLE